MRFDSGTGLRQDSELVESPSNAPPSRIDGLLVNPAAGGGRALEVLPALRDFAKERSWGLQICVTADAEELARKAKLAASQGYRRIFVLGGDGTFQALLNALADYPQAILGILPAGGGNDLAASLGLPNDPLRAATLLFEGGEPCQLDAVQVRTADGCQRLYSGGGGVGLDAEAARYANGAYRHLRGRLRYLLAAVRALCGFHSIRVRMRIEPGEADDLEFTALLVGVLNTPSYGAGLYLAPQARTDDGALDVVVLQDLGIIEIVRLLATLWSKGELKSERVLRFSARRVRIETENPCSFHGDGEILGQTPVEISVVPRAFWVLRAPGKR
jgi:diacylglycerol kinase (ATP)